MEAHQHEPRGLQMDPAPRKPPIVLNTKARSRNNCWTCLLRHKKCDRRRPVCEVCASLRITCHNDEVRPEWMADGPRRKEMVEHFKREVRERAPWRRVDGRRPRIPSDTDQWVFPREWSTKSLEPAPAPAQYAVDTSNASQEPSSSTGKCCAHAHAHTHGDADAVADGAALGSGADSILVMFYLEHVSPFLFPFYRPPVAQGGRGWLLDIMVHSPVVRRAALCQGSFFFCLARGAKRREDVCQAVYAQVREAFRLLGWALRSLVDGDGEGDGGKDGRGGGGSDPKGAACVLAGVVQMLRFEVAALSAFENCRFHLDAALALFEQLLEGGGDAAAAAAGPRARFEAVVERLGPATRVPPAEHASMPSAAQAAFAFSTALLLFDDVIASTVLQEPPRLYEYHGSLLGGSDGSEDKPAIDLCAVLGCRNWPIVQIGEIARLDAWKQRCQATGTLSVIELVARAAPIKALLEARLAQLESEPPTNVTGRELRGLLDLLTPADDGPNQSRLVTLVWAHAALLYLLVVVSGWQPASGEVRLHVERVVELLADGLHPVAMLRMAAWPFCVAGCLAEPALEARLRGLVEAARPFVLFATVRKAWDIMQCVWRHRDDDSIKDLRSCFGIQGEMVLLV